MADGRGRKGTSQLGGGAGRRLFRTARPVGTTVLDNPAVRAKAPRGGGGGGGPGEEEPPADPNLGVVWNLVTSPYATPLPSVTYGEDLFVSLVFEDLTRAIYSDDGGLTWAAAATPTDFYPRDIAYGNGTFVAVGENDGGAVAMYSADGINWQMGVTPGDGSHWSDICFGNGLFVAVAGNGVTNGKRIMTSPDGAVWTLRDTPNIDGWSCVEFGNGLFVALTPWIESMTSPDGVVWTQRVIPEGQWQDLAFGGGKFVAVGSTDPTSMVSEDGINWVESETAGPNWTTHNGVIYGGGMFARVAYNEFNMSAVNLISTSVDGLEWTVQEAGGPDVHWKDIAYGGGKFVAVGQGNVATSDLILVSP